MSGRESGRMGKAFRVEDDLFVCQLLDTSLLAYPSLATLTGYFRCDNASNNSEIWEAGSGSETSKHPAALSMGEGLPSQEPIV